LQIHDIVEDKKGKIVATLNGKRDKGLYYVIGGSFGKGKGSTEFWERKRDEGLLTHLLIML